jgi:hypothetical protein
VTVEGCLVREDAVPGRNPSVAEKLGLGGKDFLLTNTKLKKGLAPGAVADAKGDSVGTSGTSGAMFELKGIDDETLTRHLNRRVEVDGAFDHLDAKGSNLIELRATAIRAAKGECSK